jgi:hypothetical protein
MGEKTIGFVEKANDFAKQNPNLVPPYLEMSAFGTDFTDAHGLWTLHNMVLQLEEGIGDTEMSAGSEAYQAALVFYKSVKMAAVRHTQCKSSLRRTENPFPRRQTQDQRDGNGDRNQNYQGGSFRYS